jgi:hypothetical protein
MLQIFNEAVGNVISYSMKGGIRNIICFTTADLSETH